MVLLFEVGKPPLKKLPNGGPKICAPKPERKGENLCLGVEIVLELAFVP